MESFVVSAILIVSILDASYSQQLYNPLGRHIKASDNAGTLIHEQHHTTQAVSGDSMRALLDVSGDNFDQMSYEDYYNSVPYYDIVDYFYIEDSNNSTAASVSEDPLSTGSKSTTITTIVSSQPPAQAQTLHAVNVFSTGNDLVSSKCDVITHFGCDVTRFERCDSETQTCRCIGGYLKPQNGINNVNYCTAAKFFQGEVNIPITHKKLSALSTEAVRIVRERLLDYIQHILQKHHNEDNLLALEIGTSVIRNIETPSIMLLTYEIATKRNTSSTMSLKLRELLQEELQNVSSNIQGPAEELVNTIGHMSSRGYGPTDANVFSKLIVWKSLVNEQIEISPCSSPDHNYCDPNAACRTVNASQMCECLPGFQDMSTDQVRFPGEICEEQCKCENQGICIASLQDYTIKECSCIKWFFGSNCQLNGKELLIIIGSCMACLVVVVVTVCCCCQARVRHKNRHTESSLFRFTPDTSILKLPRVWMEAQYPDTGTVKDFSPQSVRRMSIATECNPYFDGYMVEDVPANCFQSDTSADIPAHHPPHPEAPLGAIPGASTVSSHSIFRHY